MNEKVTRKTVIGVLSKPESINYIREELEKQPDHTRRSLSGVVCAHFNLYDPLNRPRISTCQVVLRELENRGKFVLPKAVHSGRIRNVMVRLNAPVPEPKNLPDRVDKMKGLEIILIGMDDKTHRKIWNEMMIREHPQGHRPMMGRQLRYLFRAGDDWIGGAGFSGASLKLADRENWLGWDDEQRSENLERIVNMARFLIRGGVNCKNLASHVMSLLLKRFPDDYQARYGYRPWLLESFVDTSRFSGTCYKASNWKNIGKTKGRGRNDRHTKANETVKDIYVYVLEPRFREQAGLPPEGWDALSPLALTDNLGGQEWAAHEFSGAELGDQRLTARLVKIASECGANPSVTYSTVTRGDRYAIKAYYNFLGNGNDEVNYQEILSPHYKRTLQRVMNCDLVYSIQDTTDANYGRLKKCQGLGIISKGKNSKGTAGLNLHSLLMVDKTGMPLGIGYAECYAPELANSYCHRNSLPIEDKESFRWLNTYLKTIDISRECPETKVISVMDREADIYEIYQEALKNKNRVPVVIRAQHNRCLVNSKQKLFEKLERSTKISMAEITVPAQRAREAKGNKPARPAMKERTAKLTISYEKVTIKPPATCLKKGWEPLPLYAVYAREKNPPPGAEPIKWFIVTTLEISSSEDAFRCVRIYRLRWRIEEFHRVLKSGCKVEKHRQRTSEKLKMLIAIDMVIAWRIMVLTLMGRKCPELPCDFIFDKNEWQVLGLVTQKKTNTATYS